MNDAFYLQGVCRKKIKLMIVRSRNVVRRTSLLLRALSLTFLSFLIPSDKRYEQKYGVCYI